MGQCSPLAYVPLFVLGVSSQQKLCLGCVTSSRRLFRVNESLFFLGDRKTGMVGTVRYQKLRRSEQSCGTIRNRRLYTFPRHNKKGSRKTGGLGGGLPVFR